MSHITTVPEKFPRTDCSTIIVGKNASSTGHVLMGHNEDDMGCYVQSHLVPHAAHQPGETVTFADAPAVIPQTPETLGFYWSEFAIRRVRPLPTPSSTSAASRSFQTAVSPPRSRKTPRTTASATACGT